jgi:polyribonucleotide nucleotidyltransferase
MIEAGAKQIPEEELIDALEFAEGVCRELNDLQAEIIRELGQPKMEWTPADTSDDGPLKPRVGQVLSRARSRCSPPCRARASAAWTRWAAGLSRDRRRTRT